jgi:hypothetical protein
LSKTKTNRNQEPIKTFHENNFTQTTNLLNNHKIGNK